MQEGTNIVLIAPDLLDTFPDSEAVNEALRSLKKIATRSVKPAQRGVKLLRLPVRDVAGLKNKNKCKCGGSSLRSE
jgi:hypothetical protein